MITPVQTSFFNNEELLPYHEIYMWRRRKYKIHVTKEGPNYKGEMILSAGYLRDHPHDGYSGPNPIDSDVPTLIAEIKARIERIRD